MGSIPANDDGALSFPDPTEDSPIRADPDTLPVGAEAVPDDTALDIIRRIRHELDTTRPNDAPPTDKPTAREVDSGHGDVAAPELPIFLQPFVGTPYEDAGFTGDVIASASPNDQNSHIVEAAGDSSTVTAASISNTIPSVNSGPQISAMPDPTAQVPTEKRDFDISTFELALGLWIRKNNISRDAYAGLIETLNLASTMDDIHNLPGYKDTILHRTQQVLPPLQLRSRTVDLNMAKLPSRSKPTEEMLVFDVQHLVTTLISSESVMSKIYRGMAHFTDDPIQHAWQAPWWGESTRSTSGEFHRYPDGSPILPSDFIVFGEDDGTGMARVRWSGLDVRTGESKPLLIVQRLYIRGQGMMPGFLQELDPTMRKYELAPECEEVILVEDGELEISPSQVIEQLGPSSSSLPSPETIS
ncbi:hypothetical protein MCOR29_008232 [Pyricularia oryzae]|uniref:Uncharacterized protein n=1 Tax=Pyricularia grisea TaxID=148305 RepID=A0ABQ8NJV8_PYRGI|nr:hypothetical protein MCOR33_005708 [Pyricularia grisea]KAI6311658.1 hypothetical protein MCOR29_008232 [Pyricularia oryzae]KAI6363022.1 hypothetical protein MCOR32_008295 [Pyricularia oryzae]KAI6487758.1 hypothetical protein MCOR11_008712 [Pyricularia oryzae]KAI6522022.1 hypothetical protein MCOR10_005756 [Pyricularia oryzae]